MQMVKTQSCALQEIAGLSSHDSAELAMREFCKQNFSAPVKYGGVIASRDSLYSFYLFTASLAGYCLPYGTNFAKFIRDHKLGEVWESPKITNLAFHSDHKNQVWVWMPDVKALRKWWDNQVKGVKPDVSKPPPEPKKCGCGAELDGNGLCCEGCDDEYEPEPEEPYYDEDHDGDEDEPPNYGD